MIQTVDLIIRLATPDDIDKLAELHCASFRPEDHVPMMLGRHYVRATYHWQVTSKEAYTLVAESNGKIIGLVAVCDGPFTWPMFKACLREFILSLIRNPSLLFKKMLWQRFFRRTESSNDLGEKIANYPGVAQMTTGAVDPGFHGKGVFGTLIEATKTVSKARGSKAIRAGVYKKNLPCRTVFIKGGWIQSPSMETSDTVFYLAYLDPNFSKVLETCESRF